MRPTKRLRVPLYGVGFDIYIAHDLEAVGRELNLPKDQAPDTYTLAQVNVVDRPSTRPESRGEPTSRILLLIRPDAHPNTIAHECFHVASHVFHYIEAPISDGESNEPFAYLIGWVVEEVDKALRSV